MQKFNKLSKAEMRNIGGGVASLALVKSNLSEDYPTCYQCCTPDFSLCGSCDTRGNGGCEGNGVPVSFCGC